MREVLDDVERWRQAGRRVAVARVVGVDGSGPRDPGATMAVSEDGAVAGSVSGGCVEGAVLTEALAWFEDGSPRLLTSGISDEDAFAVGLTCGGTIHVLAQPLDTSAYDSLRAALGADDPVALATVVAGSGLGANLAVRPGRAPVGTLGNADLERVVARDALGELESGATGTRHYGPNGEARQQD